MSRALKNGQRVDTRAFAEVVVQRVDECQPFRRLPGEEIPGRLHRNHIVGLISARHRKRFEIAGSAGCGQRRAENGIGNVVAHLQLLQECGQIGIAPGQFQRGDEFGNAGGAELLYGGKREGQDEIRFSYPCGSLEYVSPCVCDHAETLVGIRARVAARNTLARFRIRCRCHGEQGLACGCGNAGRIVGDCDRHRCQQGHQQEHCCGKRSAHWLSSFSLRTALQSSRYGRMPPTIVARCRRRTTIE